MWFSRSVSLILLACYLLVPVPSILHGLFSIPFCSLPGRPFYGPLPVSLGQGQSCGHSRSSLSVWWKEASTSHVQPCVCVGTSFFLTKNGGGCQYRISSRRCRGQVAQVLENQMEPLRAWSLSRCPPSPTGPYREGSLFPPCLSSMETTPSVETHPLTRRSKDRPSGWELDFGLSLADGEQPWSFSP